MWIRFPIIAALSSLLLCSASLPVSAQEAREYPSPAWQRLIVDTDGGVDDVMAIGYIFGQRLTTVVGFGAVAGNTTVENAANNILLAQELAGDHAPLAIGAAAPLAQPLSTTGKLIHGADGLWGIGAAHPHDLSAVRRDLPQFYAELASQHPGATLLALGPLTNVAQAIQAHPAAMAKLGRIVVLGGAKQGGNFTTVAEFNVGLDPEAAAIVFAAGIPITLVTLDTTAQVTFTPQQLSQLTATSSSPVVSAIAPAVSAYAAVQTGLGGLAAVSLPDVTAAVIATCPAAAATTPSLVRVELVGALTRGKTVIASTFSEHVQTIATDAELSAIADQAASDPSFDVAAALGAIVAREPDNVALATPTLAQLVLLRALSLRGLR